MTITIPIWLVWAAPFVLVPLAVWTAFTISEFQHEGAAVFVPPVVLGVLIALIFTLGRLL